MDWFDTIFTIDETSKAFQYLVQLFGTWVGELYGLTVAGSEVTAITVTLGYANTIAMVFGAAVTSYLFAASSVNGAITGSMLAKGWSPFFTPLKVGLSYILIIPVHVSSGFGDVSYAQSLVIRGALIGSGVADYVWEQSARAIVEKPIVSVPDVGSFQVVSNVLRAQVCAIALRHADGPAGEYDESYSEVHEHRYYLKSTRQIPTQRNNGPVTYDTESVFNSKDFIGESMTIDDLSGVSEIQFGQDGDCGSLKVPIEYAHHIAWLDTSGGPLTDTQIDPTDFYLRAKAIARESGKQNLVDMFNYTKELAESIIDLSGDSGEEISSFKAESSLDSNNYRKYVTSPATVFADISNHYNLEINSSIRAAFAENKSEFTDEFVEYITKSGWIYAGVTFWEITRIQDAMVEVAQSYRNGLAEYSTPISACGQSWWEWAFEEDCKARTLIKMEIADIIILESYKVALKEQKYYALHSQASALSSCSKDSCGNNPMNASFLSAPGLTQAILPDGASQTAAQGASPYTTLTQLGHRILDFVVAQQIIETALAGTKETTKIAANSVGPFGSILGYLIAVLEKMLAIIFAMTLILAPLGYLLAFVFPFIPVMYWINLVVGWFVTVTEAYAAAPLAAVLSAIPEGEGISGMRQERVIALIAALILRPCFNLFGLIVAIGIGYIAFGFFNEIFWMKASLDDIKAFENGILAASIIEPIALLVLYITSVMALMRYVFSIIFEFNTHIMEWITSGASRAFGETSAGIEINSGGDFIRGMTNSTLKSLRA